MKKKYKNVIKQLKTKEKIIVNLKEKNVDKENINKTFNYDNNSFIVNPPIVKRFGLRNNNQNLFFNSINNRMLSKTNINLNKSMYNLPVNNNNLSKNALNVNSNILNTNIISNDFNSNNLDINLKTTNVNVNFNEEENSSNILEEFKKLLQKIDERLDS